MERRVGGSFGGCLFGGLFIFFVRMMVFFGSTFDEKADFLHQLADRFVVLVWDGVLVV